MDDPQAPPRQIQQALAQGWTVLTANQRAARTLRHTFDVQQRALGFANWQPPAILAWDAWLGSLWRGLLLAGHASGLLLSSTQEHTIWRAIISADAATSSLRPVDSLAETAASAWLLLHAYRGRQRLQDFPGNADTRAFVRWVSEFDRRCARSQYLTQAQLPQVLRKAIAAGHFPIPSGLLLVGFDSKTPAQTGILDAVQATGASIEELSPQTGLAPTHAPPTAQRTLVDAPDEDAELTACARWLRTRLTEHPDACIAVIVPAIETGRAEIDRVFRHILAPELNDINAPSSSSPWEFSLGVPLANTPMATTALDILRWAVGALPLDRVCALLLSPYFAADYPESTAEHLSRAEFDAFTLRNQHLLEPEVSLDALYRIASQSNQATRLPILLNHLRALRPLFNRGDSAGERTHADWAASMHELLEAAGWALPSRLDSIEFQARRKWESALDELATLDFESVRVPFAAALVALERIAAETLFAPETRHAPVQIMGPLESAGSTFDALWFLRANDIAWPSTPAPNPLLPWQLQRDLAMPGADPAHDTALARRITERISTSAPVVVFSYAQESTEGRQRPSPVVSGLALEARSAIDIAPAAPVPAPVEIDVVTDDTPIPPPPDRVLQGGAAILESQAACGFRAFAERRLFASALEAASLGLDPRERGSLVHNVLQRFWEKVETQAALKRMTVSERDEQLTNSIDAALAKDHARPEPGWPRAYVATERQRLLNLLRPWLDYEANVRAPFTVKSREETLSDVRIGPLRLSIRVDRVDLTHTEGDSNQPPGEIIIDYKTGAAKPADWLGDRPDAPQLPLYAVVSNASQLAGVAFASVRPGTNMGMNGYQAHDSILPKCTKLQTESLDAQVLQWREVLTSLAEDFHSGEARVSPKSYPQTCKYCEQRLLCRLDVASLEAEVLEDLDAGSDPSGPEVDLG
jgi:ATP-dependent helicase/nuclease subunit B